MKNKVVIWGTNAENEKVLIALELKADANKVILYTFPEAIATDEFVNKMMNDWRDGKDVEFPEGHTTLERELSVTESLLPDDLKLSGAISSSALKRNGILPSFLPNCTPLISRNWQSSRKNSIAQRLRQQGMGRTKSLLG